MKVTWTERFHNKKFLAIFCTAAVLVVAAIVTVSVLLLSRYEEVKQEEHVAQVNKVLENTDTFFDGIYVQGVDVSGMTMDEATAAVGAVESTTRPNIELTMTYNGKSYVYTTDNFGFSYDTASILQEAYAIGRTGTAEECYDQVEELKTTPASFAITAVLDDNSVQAVVDDVAGQINVAMVDAHATGVDFSKSGSDRFEFTEGTSGLAVDTTDLKAKTDAALAQETKVATISVVANTVAPTRSAAAMKAQVQEICSFSTTSTNTAAGNTNMALALSFCNGKIVNPGETFSFCKTTGNSTNGNLGYVKAGVILNGKSEQDYGGGICQASTTLYGAVLRADLTVVERHNHTWPSKYVPIGQDAAVSYPGTDFRFRNDTDVPVFIQASMSGTKLTVTLYGYKSTEYDSINVVSRKTGTMATSLGTGCTASGEKQYIKDGQVIRTESIPNSSYRKDGAGGNANVDAVDTETENTVSETSAASETTVSEAVSTPSETPASSTPSASESAASSETAASSGTSSGETTGSTTSTDSSAESTTE